VFGAGGTVAAFLFPIHLFLTGIAFPLGWFDPITYDRGLALMKSPLAKLYFLVLISLPLFHWAHRFRYTLYDGLQIKHLTLLIVILCYGSALVGTAFAAYTLWNMP
jgi:fumarate reductase subunit D